MGTWDVGPFDNDTAADFCGDLDDAPAEDRLGLVRAALSIGAAADDEAELDASVAETAVAAAALVAAQCPGGEPVDPVYGPEQPIPDLLSLRGPALQALDRVLAEGSELRDLWEQSDGEPWREGVEGLRGVLRPSGE
ncbi:DUF4259 domain-containing protein [Streptomyces sp. NPDC051214]|uniref:DUF4259 domain-containing protein n=1 Tax=Streptomyces sp. NPDC051214 TaxID=3155282 RepID=UPI0034475B0E